MPSAKSETLSLHNSSTHSSRSNTLERPSKSTNKESGATTHRLPTHEVNFIDTYLIHNNGCYHYYPLSIDN